MQLHAVKLLEADAQNLAGDLIWLGITYMVSHEDHLVVIQSLDPKLIETAKQYPTQ